jgi:hypothetical protein
MPKISSSLLAVGLIWMGLTAGSSLYPAQIYQSGSQKVRRVVEELSANAQAGDTSPRTYRLSQVEINAYLLDQLRQQEENAVENISILLGEGTFLTLITIDPDRLQMGGNAAAGRLLGALLEGSLALEIKGRILVSDGSGKYQIQQIRFNGMELPIALVTELLISLGRSQDPPFDPTSSFSMPFGIQSIVVSGGQVVIET